MVELALSGIFIVGFFFLFYLIFVIGPSIIGIGEALERIADALENEETDDKPANDNVAT